MGPWRAALDVLRTLGNKTERVTRVQIDLYGSLAKTGRGHGTDLATYLGLCGDDPKTVDIERVRQHAIDLRELTTLKLGGTREIPFSWRTDVRFHFDVVPEYHPNGLDIGVEFADGQSVRRRYYSIGGGFIVCAAEECSTEASARLPFPVDNAMDLLRHTSETNMSISQVVEHNEAVWRTTDELHRGVREITQAMLACVSRGLASGGDLPGGLMVRRRAHAMAASLFAETGIPDRDHLVQSTRRTVQGLSSDRSYEFITRWISCCALAVNEENAAYGRVVTAPTNGAAGVIPAVLLYYLCFDSDAPEPESEEMYASAFRFLLNAGEIGSIFKKGATISAAMGGCQAEIGVSSAMAASALTELKGGSPAACLQAAEIAMEHHLGLTCDPVGGLVQIPCIERNTMGAVKAIAASNLALTSDPSAARVSLDHVVQTMWDTACDMSDKYKETSEAGLAVHIPINVIEC